MTKRPQRLIFQGRVESDSSLWRGAQSRLHNGVMSFAVRRSIGRSIVSSGCGVRH